MASLEPPRQVMLAIRALDSADRDFRLRAVHELHRWQNRASIPAILSHLDEPDEDIREGLFSLLKELSEASEVVLQRMLGYVTSLDDPRPTHPEVFRPPLRLAMGVIRAVGDLAVPCLREFSDAVSVSLRYRALNCLVALRYKEINPLPTFAEHVTDPDRWFRLTCIRGLTILAKNEWQIESALEDAARGETDAFVGAVADLALERCSRGAHRQQRKSIAVLIQVLRQGEPTEQLKAIQAVGWLGRVAWPTVPLLMDCLSRREGGDLERRWLLSALARSGMDDSRTTERVVEALRQAPVDLKISYLQVLRSIGPPAHPIAAWDLLRLMDAEDPQVREGAILCISTIGVCGEHMGRLLERLRDEAVIVRRPAAHALGHCRAEFKEQAVTALRAAGQDSDSMVRYHAAASLRAHGEPVPEDLINI